MAGAGLVAAIVAVALIAGGGDDAKTDGGETATPVEFALPASLGDLALEQNDQVDDQVGTILNALPPDQRTRVKRSLEVGLYSNSVDNALAFIFGGTASERQELLDGFNEKLSDEVGSTLEVGAVDAQEFTVGGHDVVCLEGNQLTWCRAEDGGLLVLVASQMLSMDTIADLAAEAVETAPDA